MSAHWALNFFADNNYCQIHGMEQDKVPKTEQVYVLLRIHIHKTLFPQPMFFLSLV
jgi:hypothetical protein